VEAEAAVTRGFIALCLFVGLALLGIGARALTVLDAGSLTTAALVSAFIFGLWVPLALMLYAVRRRRVAVLALAFCVGLSVNVVFLAHAVPANAAADNTTDFYMTGANTYGCSGVKNMPQTAPPDNSGGVVYAGGSGVSNTFCSDTFSSSQSLSAGTTVANMYFANSSGTKDCNVLGELFWFHNSNSTTTSLGSGATTIPHNNAAAIDFSWSWPTSAVAAFADGDRLEYTLTYTSSGTNCNNTAYDAYYVGFASRITVATIVPEGVVGLLPLAASLPFAARWWKRRRP
jgi:hypothetical protein